MFPSRSWLPAALSLCAVIAACSADTTSLPLSPKPPLSDLEVYQRDSAPTALIADCDPALTAQLTKASFGTPTKAFVGIPLTYEARAVRSSNGSEVELTGTSNWRETNDFLSPDRLSIWLPFVDLSTNRSITTIAGTSVGSTLLRVELGAVTGVWPHNAACATFTINVEPSDAIFTFTPSSPQKIPVDYFLDIKVLVRNPYSSPLPQDGLTFVRLSGPAASVSTQLADSVFRVQPEEQGLLTLRASLRGASVNYTLDVCSPSTQATSLVLSKPLPTVAAGSSATATAVARNCVNQPLPVSWRSSDTTIAKVSSSGVVTGIYPGTAYITAFRGSLADSAIATIVMPSPDLAGSLVFNPPYPTGRAHLSWQSVPSATHYKLYRKCQMSNGGTLGWEFSDILTGTSHTTYDYVTSFAGGIFPPSGAYIAYYLIAVDAFGIESGTSQIAYFNWDEVAEPQC